MTTTPDSPDFRALCEELVELLDSEWFGVSYQPPALDRAHAALATTPPEPPTDEELDQLWDEEAEYFNLYEEARCFARAVLERWG